MSTLDELMERAEAASERVAETLAACWATMEEDGTWEQTQAATVPLAEAREESRAATMALCTEVRRLAA